MLSIITCRETVLGPRNTLTEKINLLLFRARDILRKRPKLAKRSKSKNVFLKHLTLVLSLISQIRTKFQSSLVYIKNNQIDVRSENESYEFKEDNVLPVGGAYLLSSFENALVYSENKKTTVQPHSKRNYRKFQMAIVPALETLFTHFSDLIRLVVRGDQLMCVNINEELQKRDVIIQIPDLINSLKNETDNKYGMQKVPMKPVSIDYEALFYTDDEEYTTDDDDDDNDNDTEPAENSNNTLVDHNVPTENLNNALADHNIPAVNSDNALADDTRPVENSDNTLADDSRPAENSNNTLAKDNVPTENSNNTLGNENVPADNSLSNSSGNRTGNTDVNPQTGSTEVQIKSQEPIDYEYQEIPLVIKLDEDVQTKEYIEGEPDRVWPLVDLTDDTTTSIETNEKVLLEFSVEETTSMIQTEQNCNENVSTENEIESNRERKPSIEVDDEAWKSEMVHSNTNKSTAIKNIYWQRAIDAYSKNSSSSSSSSIIDTQPRQPSTVQSNANAATEKNIWQKAMEQSLTQPRQPSTVQSNTNAATERNVWQTTVEQSQTQPRQPSTVQSNTNAATENNVWLRAFEQTQAYYGNNSTQSTENPRWKNLGQNRTRKIILQEKSTSIPSKRKRECWFFGSKRAISERTTTLSRLTAVPQNRVLSTSTSSVPTLRVKTDIFIERDPRKRKMSNNIVITEWNPEDDLDYNSTNF
jgi:hypothetical protein